MADQPPASAGLDPGPRDAVGAGGERVAGPSCGHQQPHGHLQPEVSVHQLLPGELVEPGGGVLVDRDQLTAHPKRLSLLRAVQSDPDLTATYFDIVAGVEPVTALHAPRLLALL
jgi:hypothetical protein